MESLIKTFSTINKYICTVLLLVMVGVVFANTVLRYFFSSGIIMTEELVRYLFLWAIYLGVVSVWFTRGHIRVTTVTDRLSPHARIKCSMFFELVSVIVLIVLGVGAFQYFMDTTTVGQATGLPYSILIFAMVVGAFACVFVSFLHIKQDYALLSKSAEELLQMEKEAYEAQLRGE